MPRILVALSFWLLLRSCLPAASADQPNVVLILADDLGWSDLSCYGADLIETPHIDQLAEQGVQFMQAYAMPVCSPSRAALMTGKHSARLRMTIWSEGSLQGPKNRRLLQADSLHDLPLVEQTLAEHFHASGYLTALVGKWHLGDAGHFPETQGFDINVGGNHWGAPQTFWWPYRGDQRYGGEFRYVPHMEFGNEGEYLTDRLTDEAIRIMEQAADQPFFLYLAHYAPHTPIEAKAGDIAYFESKLTPQWQHQNAVYAAMVKNLDDNVGRVLSYLEKRDLLQETIVIFASDNGGYIGTDRGQSVPATNNAPLRSGKGSLYEGGIRVPLIVRWPGVSKSNVVCDEPVTLMDLFHTLRPLAVGSADASPPSADKLAVDGLNLTPLLTDPKTVLHREALYFHYPHYYTTTTPVSAIRAGNWKLLEYFEDGHVELYDLAEDPAESHDLAMQLPDKAKQLQAKLDHWRESVSAALPTPNPAYNPNPARGRDVR